MTKRKSIPAWAWLIITAAILAPFFFAERTHAQSVGILTATGQQAVTGSAVALASQANTVGCIKAVPGNSLTVYIGLAGVTTSTGYPLAAGESFCSPTNNLNRIFVIASTTGSSVAWFVTNQGN